MNGRPRAYAAPRERADHNHDSAPCELGYEVNPDYLGTNDQGHDWAFCRLQEPVTELSITPPVAGPCENTIIRIGQEVAIAGFGQTLDDQTGVKH